MAFDNNIITITDIQDYKPLSKNTDTEKKVDPFIQEAQEFDLRPFMGDEFYLELIYQFKNSFPNSDYQDLFEGNTWTKDGRTYENPGLRAVLVYCSYARYLNKANTNSTAFGMVTKENPDSSPISDRTIDRLVNQADSGGSAYLNRVKFYLDCNKNLFEAYEKGCGISQGKKSSAIRISAGGGNNSNKRKYDPVSKRYYY